jgi:hypothetical protein
MEHTVQECEALVQRVSTFVLLSLERGRAVSPALRKVHAVDHLVAEVTLSQSFESYLRWAPLRDLASIAEDLEAVGLAQAAWVTRLALRTGFASGIPKSDAERDSCVSVWTLTQRAALEGLADYLEDPEGQFVRSLAEYVLTLGEECLGGSAGLH